MSSNFNQCSQLANDFDTLKPILQARLDAGENHLQIMLDMQQSLQTELAESLGRPYLNPQNNKTCGDILRWMQMNDDFIADETRELYTALGGMSNPKPAAVWKPWRKEHDEYFNRPFSELSEEDRLEIAFELVDSIHFVLNKINGLGLNADDLLLLYAAKNAENFARQERGY